MKSAPDAGMTGQTGPVAPAADGAGQQARTRILDASVTLFAMHGFQGVSTTRIAEAAGISQSVVLYHFGSKDRLWRSAMLHLFQRIGAVDMANTAELKDLDAVAQLKVLLRRFIRLSAHNPELGRIIMREGAEGGQRLSWLVRNALAENYAIYTGVVARAQECGDLKPYPPFQLTILMHAACSMLFNLQPLVDAMEKQPLRTGSSIDALCDMILDVLFNGIGVAKEQKQ